MMIFNDPINSNLRDVQHVRATTSTSTASTTYVDLDSITLTTKNINSANSYIISYSALLIKDTSPANGVVYFLVSVNGVDILATEITFGGVSNSFHKNVHFQTKINNILAGQIIKIRWKTTGTSHSITAREMTILGIKTSNIAQ